MRVLILGADGYLGRSTAIYLREKGHDVVGIDNYFKRLIESECSVAPLSPAAKMHEEFSDSFVTDISKAMPDNLGKFDAIIHYGEQPSAPYSMMDRERCNRTQVNNVVGNLNVLWYLKKNPDTHLIKLGTMGSYGVPNIDIEEGWLDVEHNGRKDRMLYPKKPMSFYHASKVHDSTNIELACRIWGLKATDLNQGVVYGNYENSSFHYDHIFGTALNRFIVQAVAGIPLTVYGSGRQIRGWLNILDTLQCVELALMTPAEAGEFRVMNQFTEQFSVLELAEKVANLTGADIQHIDNPRTEQEEHYYNAKHSALEDLGLKPHLLNDDVLSEMVEYVEKHKENINTDFIMPKVRWK